MNSFWGDPPWMADMGKLTPIERRKMLKRVKELDIKMQDPRLTIERVDEMHSERAELRAKLLEDRAER